MRFTKRRIDRYSGMSSAEGVYGDYIIINDSRQTTPISTKRIRKLNFSEGEIRTLIAAFSQYSGVLQSRFSATVTQRVKHDIWNKIAAATSACGVASRSACDTKKKWADIKRLAIKCASAAPGDHGFEDGLPNSRPWYTDMVLDLIGAEGTRAVEAAVAAVAAAAADGESRTWGGVWCHHLGYDVPMTM